MLEKIGYDQHKWFICVDLKIVNFLLRQKTSFTKYPCFLCRWDSRNRAQHYTKKDWPLREELVPCKEKNIDDPLVDRDRILFPPLHIKLGLIKQFIKALDKDGDCFTYLCWLFQDWPRRSWKLASLTVLRSGNSSEIQISKTQWTKWNWKRERHLFWWWRTLLATIRPETTQNLSTCWLLSEIWAATWASRCTSYFHIWTGFLRTWVQWVTSRGRDSIRTWKRWRQGIRVAGTQSWWLTTVGIWRETSLPLSIPGVRRNGSSSPEVWTMVKQHAIYVYLPLSIPTIQFTVINVSIR